MRFDKAAFLILAGVWATCFSAAATAVAMAPGSAPRPPGVVFRADHPFVFLIVDRKTGLVLFLGRVAEP